jgi:hypothetical protein
MVEYDRRNDNKPSSGSVESFSLLFVSKPIFERNDQSKRVQDASSERRKMN